MRKRLHIESKKTMNTPPPTDRSYPIKAKSSEEHPADYFDRYQDEGILPTSLEIGGSDDANEAWSDMQVRHSQEEGSASLIERGLYVVRSSKFYITAAAAIFLLMGFLLTQIDTDVAVAPIRGEAYLTTNEFAGIRIAKPNETVLVTGGLGFIGSHVVDLLLHRGFSVTILDDESNGHNHNRFAKEMVPHDITVVGDLPEIGKGSSFTHVVHLAAAISVAESMNDPDKYERVNYGGSEKVFNWIRNYNQYVSQSDDAAATFIHKVTAASSAAVYGDPDPTLLPLRETAPYGGKSPYADTKFRMEGLMRDFVEEQNKNEGPKASAVALRFFNVFGPRQDPKNPYSGVISLFLEAAQHDKDITVLGDGEMTRDFVYVKDVARAIVMSLLQESTDDKASFDNFNVCTGKSITINTLADQVREKMKSSSEIKHLAPRDGDIRESSCNSEKAAKLLHFTSTVTQEEGLEKTAVWFGEQSTDSRERKLEHQSSTQEKFISWL